MKQLAIICISTSLVFLACKQAPKTNTDQAKDTATVLVPEIPQEPERTDTQRVSIKTSMGEIIVRLYNETPKHRDNFIKLIKRDFYKDLLFHRVIKNFMVQGGDPNSRNAQPGDQLGAGDVGYTIPAEFNRNLIHKKGALAAARQGDEVNPAKESSGCQFYIVQGEKYDSAKLQQLSLQSGIMYSPELGKKYATLGGTPFLDMQYTVFGEVEKGLEIVDKIAAVATEPGNRPLKDIKFSITVIEPKAKEEPTAKKEIK